MQPPARACEPVSSPRGNRQLGSALRRLHTQRAAGLHLSRRRRAPEACLAIGYQTPWWSDHLVFELGVTGLHSRRQGAVDFKGNALGPGVFPYDEIRNQTSVMGSVLFRVPFNRGI